MNKRLFEEIPDRRDTHSLKWAKYRGRDILPLWVADMDFKSPPEVVNEAKKAAEFGNFGYFRTPDSLTEVVIQRSLKLYDWKIEPHWIIWLPGMVCGLNVSCRALEKGIYSSFYSSSNLPPIPFCSGKLWSTFQADSDETGKGSIHV